MILLNGKEKLEVMKINKVLLDTCFLIELAKENAPMHKNAVDYFNYFNNNDIPYFISPIVISEYWQNEFVKDFCIDYFKQLSFNVTNGLQVGEMYRLLYKVDPGHVVNKMCIKDDIKILSHLIVNSDIDCFITKDSNCIKDFIDPLKEHIPAFNNLVVIDINDSISSNLVPQIVMEFPAQK